MAKFTNASMLKKITSELTKVEKNLSETKQKREDIIKEYDAQIQSLSDKRKECLNFKQNLEKDIEREKERQKRLAKLLGQSDEDEEIDESDTSKLEETNLNEEEKEVLESENNSDDIDDLSMEELEAATAPDSNTETVNQPEQQRKWSWQ